MIKSYFNVALIISGLSFLLLQSGTAAYAAPPNDDCANAIDLTINPTCSFTAGTVDMATESAPATSCNGFTSVSAFDVWYKFTAGSSGEVITVKGSASFDAIVLLMDGCAGSVINCSDNSGSGGTEMLSTSGLTAGNTYYIRVYSYGSALPATLSFDICVSLPAPPPFNDECSNAELLTVDSMCNYTSGSVAGATQSYPADTCGNFTSSSSYDVWYKFVAVSNKTIIRVQGSLSFDASIYLIDSCNGSAINCSDYSYSGGVETIYDTSLIVGNTYFVRVYHYGAALPSTPDFEICLSVPIPVANDDCSKPIVLTVDSACNYTSGTVDGATQSLPPETCGSYTSTSAYDVWYTFTAVSGNEIISVKGSSSFDASVFLMDNCNGSVIGCADKTGQGGAESIYTDSLVPGNTYYIRIYPYGGTLPSTLTFDVCVSLPPPPPSNDDCHSAIMLTVDSVCNYIQGSLAGATESAPPDSCDNWLSSNAYDVWYKFAATAAEVIVKVQGSPSFDATLILLDSCNGAIVGCADKTGQGGTEKIFATGLTVGNTYLIRLHTFTFSGGSPPETPDFNICVHIPAPPPANDNCANAIALTAETTCNFITGTVAEATSLGTGDSCGGFTSPAAFDVWYKFTAVSSSQSVIVKGSESFDVSLFLINSCGSAPIACSDYTYAGGTEEIHYDSLTVGNTYYIRVYDYGTDLPETPEFNICLMDPVPDAIEYMDMNAGRIAVYPNPAKDNLTLKIASPEQISQPVLYRIFNLQGQLAMEGRITNSSQETISLSHLSQGMYFIRVTFGNQTLTQKLSIEK